MGGEVRGPSLEFAGGFVVDAGVLNGGDNGRRLRARGDPPRLLAGRTDAGGLASLHDML